MDLDDNMSEETLADEHEGRTENDNLQSDVMSKSKSRIRHARDVYVAEGVYKDCEDILKQFLALKTSTFEDFVTLWKDNKFSHIFDGRDTWAELLEFCEEIMAIAKGFILPPHSQIKRIGALYLMYGLYTQQPLRRHVKFRVTPQEWGVILKFVENLKAHGFIDANYIFHKMSLDGAFLTVAFPREYGLERNLRKYSMPWSAKDQELDPCSTFSLETLMSRVYRGSLKAAADKWRTKYNYLKEQLKGVTGSIFQGMDGTDMELEKVVQQNIDQVTDSSAIHPGTRKFSNIGLGRKSLKAKAFQLQSQQRNTQTAVDPLSIESTSTASTSQCRTPPNEAEVATESGSDSAESDFLYTMKPPSKRNSIRIRNQRHHKEKKKEKLEQINCTTISLPKRKTKRRINQVNIVECDSLPDVEFEEECSNTEISSPPRKKQKRRKPAKIDKSSGNTQKKKNERPRKTSKAIPSKRERKRPSQASGSAVPASGEDDIM